MIMRNVLIVVISVALFGLVIYIGFLGATVALVA
jgi:hypothetical protein